MSAISMTSVMCPSVSHPKMEGLNPSGADSRTQETHSPDHQLHQGLWLKMKGRFYTENSRRARKTFSIPGRRHKWTVGEPDVHLLSFSPGPSNVVTLPLEVLPGLPLSSSSLHTSLSVRAWAAPRGLDPEEKASSKIKTSSWSQ